MTERARIKSVVLVAVIQMSLCVLAVAAREVPLQLPDPDGTPAAMDRPVKVFILLGQSNMLGFGKITPEDKNGTLTYAIETKHKYAEFAGNVKTVESRDSWRDTSVSPTGAGYHYNHNAETQMEVGDALGRAMVELLSKSNTPTLDN